MNARAEVKRPLHSWGSASQSAYRSVGMSGKGNPSLDSESGATLPLFAVESPVQPPKRNTFKPRNSSPNRITAESIGYCLLCGKHECICLPKQPQFLPHELLTVVCLPPNTQQVTEQHWHLCTTKLCRTLLIVPDNRPAVRCPVCEQITQQQPTKMRPTAIETLETRTGEL